MGLNEHFGTHKKLFGQKSSSAQSRICVRGRGTPAHLSLPASSVEQLTDTKRFGCLQQVFFCTKLFNFPESLILIHQSPNLQSSRMAVHKSPFYEKMEPFHHPPKTQYRVPSFTHTSNQMVRMTQMSETGDINRPPRKRFSLRCHHTDTHTHTYTQSSSTQRRNTQA